MMKKRIVLCADDYGQEQEISEGILSLLQNSRISATSCLVNTPFWAAHSKWLIPYRNQADIGLHFNLTEGQPLSAEFKKVYGSEFFGLRKLLNQALLRKLNRDALRAECDAQLETYISAMGTAPDFIDGHQHVHQFPLIREALFSVYKSRNLQSYIRIVKPSLTRPAILKKLIIGCTGGSAMQALCFDASAPFNDSFSGIYDFKQSDQYPRYFRKFLQQITDGGIIMCHPAKNKSYDAIGHARLNEYNYLNSNKFVQDCAERQILLGKWPALLKYK